MKTSTEGRRNRVKKAKYRNEWMLYLGFCDTITTNASTLFLGIQTCAPALYSKTMRTKGGRFR